MRIRKKLGGLILLSMGVGMLIALIIPSASWFIAAGLIIIGFVNVFM